MQEGRQDLDCVGRRSFLTFGGTVVTTRLLTFLGRGQAAVNVGAYSHRCTTVGRWGRALSPGGVHAAAVVGGEVSCTG